VTCGEYHLYHRGLQNILPGASKSQIHCRMAKWVLHAWIHLGVSGRNSIPNAM